MIFIASVEKYSNESICAMLRHNNRSVESPTNTDIDSSKSHLNYSFSLEHKGLTDYEYYQKLVGEKYLYGRGSAREKEAITGCGWVVTLPQELHGFSEKEEAFFKGVFDFVSERYGKENIINNAIHYDEAGLPHIHVIFTPVTKLDHDVVQYKTIKTKTAVKLESGRYEYTYRFKLDDNGKKIKLNNYARMTDYYDEKISANDVLNKIELRNFHQDLQKYLTDNGIEGAVINGKTGGVNFSVKELKEFTEKTGLHLDEVREMQGDKTLLESFVESDKKVHELEQVIHEKDMVIDSLQEQILTKETTIDRMDMSDEIHHKNEQIADLSHTITSKEQELSVATERNQELEKRLANIEHTLEEKQRELEQSRERVTELKKEKYVEVTQTEKEQGWGQASSTWGERSQSGWSNTPHTIEEEKTW